MAKKSSLLSYLYVIGMALVAIGFVCPVFSGKLSGNWNGFDFINFKNDEISFVTLGAFLIIAGAAAGIVFQFVMNKKLFKLIALVVSIVGLAVLYYGCMDSKIYSMIAKQFIKIATYGFYMIIAGWVVAAAGLVIEK